MQPAMAGVKSRSALARRLGRLSRAAAVWKSSPINRRITAATLTIIAATALVKLVTAGRELVVAYEFGTNDALDAFLIAMVAPAFITGVIVGSFTPALLPTFVKVREEEGPEAAGRVAANAMAVGGALLLAITALLWVAGPALLRVIGSGFSDEKLALTLDMYRMLLPVILLHGAAKFWGTLINAGERFALVAMTPVAMPLVTVVLLLLLAPHGGIYLLVAGTLGGYLLQASLLGWIAARRHLPMLPRWHGYDAATRAVIRQYMPMTMGTLMGSGAVIVDQSMAAMLEPGSVASLTYGKKLLAIVLAFSASPLGIALLPYLSRQVAGTAWRELRHTAASWMGLTLVVSVPLTVALVLFSEDIVRIVFERGAFTAEDTQVVALVQALYSLQIPFYLAGIIGSRLLSALRLNHILAIIGALNFTSNIIFNLIFMKLIGLPGIALSTSFVYFCSSIVIWAFVMHRLRRECSGPAPVGRP